MNLVFNTFITDEPLNAIHGKDSLWQQIRTLDTTYRKRSKIDIFKYTLDSYKHLNFNKQFFWIECQDKSKEQEINDYILSIFPNAFIKNKRCLTYSEYQEMLSIVPKDDWIFFSPNNDHVFWASEKVELTEFTNFGDEISQNYNGMVGIFYSHFEEFINLPYKDTWFGQRYNSANEPRNIIHDDDKKVAFTSQYGENTSIQILHPKLFNAFFSSFNFGAKEIRRIEDLRQHFFINNQVSIVPKKTICAHFDGQPSLNPYILPPLFIPDGYFEGNIRLNFSDIYRVGELNISSKHKLYCFLDQRHGTDFIGSFEDLPYFIKEKIKSNE